MIHLLDCDLHGVDSIQEHIEAGRVNHMTCPTFQAFSKHVATMAPIWHKELREMKRCAECKGSGRIKLRGKTEERQCPYCGGAGQTGEPVVLIDSVSQLAHTTRVDHKLGLDIDVDLWEKRKSYMGDDKNYLTVYDYATDAISRTIKNIRSIEVVFNEKGEYVQNPPSPYPPGWTARRPRIIIVAHEAEQDDVTVGYKKRAPYINKALYKSLEAICSDMFRLTSIEEDMLGGDDGTKVLHKKDTRFLTLRKNDECIVKYQVRRSQSSEVPSTLVNPTMRKLWATLDKKPSVLVIYGPAGSGKTTLAVSEVEPIKATRMTENEKDKAA